MLNVNVNPFGNILITFREMLDSKLLNTSQGESVRTVALTQRQIHTEISARS